MPNFNIMVSIDGGKTVTKFPSKWKHVDNHTIWIDPDDTKYLLVGCDGGVYETYDRGENWLYKSNLPLAQLYDVAVDNALPFYFVYGGTQDNNDVGGPSRTTSDRDKPSAFGRALGRPRAPATRISTAPIAAAVQMAEAMVFRKRPVSPKYCFVISFPT